MFKILCGYCGGSLTCEIVLYPASYTGASSALVMTTKLGTGQTLGLIP